MAMAYGYNDASHLHAVTDIDINDAIEPYHTI